MIAAEETQLIRDGLWFWQSYDSSVKTDLSCCAIQLAAGLVFIDPIPLAEEPLSELVTLATPAAIVITNGNHARAAGDFRKKFGVPVFARAEAVPELGIDVDEALENGMRVIGELAVIALPGFAAGESALHSSIAGGALFVGDALINVASHGFAQLPAKYCANPKLAKRSLEKILQLDFELMTFAHGLPIVTGAKARLAEILA